MPAGGQELSLCDSSESKPGSQIPSLCTKPPGSPPPHEAMWGWLPLSPLHTARNCGYWVSRPATASLSPTFEHLFLVTQICPLKSLRDHLRPIGQLLMSSLLVQPKLQTNFLIGSSENTHLFLGQSLAHHLHLGQSFHIELLHMQMNVSQDLGLGGLKPAV